MFSNETFVYLAYRIDLTLIICFFVEVHISIQQLAVYSNEVNHAIDLNESHSTDFIWVRKTSYAFRFGRFVVQVCY